MGLDKALSAEEAPVAVVLGEIPMPKVKYMIIHLVYLTNEQTLACNSMAWKLNIYLESFLNIKFERDKRPKCKVGYNYYCVYFIVHAVISQELVALV